MRPLEHSKTHPVQHLVCAVRPASGGQQARRHTAVRTSSAALSGHRRPPRWHHGRRRELLRAAMLPPRAAAWQPSKVCSKATSGRLLPSTECSLRSGCAVDERHGAGTHTSTLCGRGRASTLTWVSLSVGKHSAAAPAVVSARSQLSATRSATLLHAARRWVHLLLALVAVGLRLLAPVR